MAKTYTQELTDWVKCKGLPQKNIHLATFLLAQEDIRSALGAGYTMRTIWCNLRELGRISFSYNTFRNYVVRYIGKAPLAPPTPETSPGRLALAKANAFKATATKKTGLPGFTFNPVPNKEELI